MTFRQLQVKTQIQFQAEHKYNFPQRPVKFKIDMVMMMMTLVINDVDVYGNDDDDINDVDVDDDDYGDINDVDVDDDDGDDRNVKKFFPGQLACQADQPHPG